MRIYEPNLKLSNEEKKLLQLLSRLILEHEGYDCSNISDSLIPLSDQEAEELVYLIEKLIEKKKFWHASHFLDHVTNMPEDKEGKLAKQIFLAGYETKKKQTIMPSYRWYEFVIRLGLGKYIKQSQSFRQQKIEPMPYDHFLKMEEKLFNKADIPEEIIKSLIAEIARLREKVEMIEKPKSSSLIKHMKKIQSRIKDEDNKTAITVDLCAAITLIVNYSMLWTTRDWGVTGTLSTLAAVHMTLFKAN